MNSLRFAPPEYGLGTHCESVLLTLPEWFGNPNARNAYVHRIESLPTFTAWEAETLIGFIAVAIPFPRSAELYVLAVRNGWHRKGIGTRLYHQVEAELQKQEISFVQVKTLSPRAGNPYYARTFAFYRHLGFTPLEDSDAIWGETTPCMQLIRHIG